MCRRIFLYMCMTAADDTGIHPPMGLVVWSLDLPPSRRDAGTVVADAVTCIWVAFYLNVSSLSCRSR
jgi:hypothetical protein